MGWTHNKNYTDLCLSYTRRKRWTRETLKKKKKGTVSYIKTVRVFSHTWRILNMFNFIWSQSICQLSGHTLGQFAPNEHYLNTTACPSTVAQYPSLYHHSDSDISHLLTAASSTITHHVTKLKSCKTGILNITMSSLYSNGLHHHQITISFVFSKNVGI